MKYLVAILILLSSSCMVDNEMGSPDNKFHRVLLTDVMMMRTDSTIVIYDMITTKIMVTRLKK